jgi:hypothetical protein
MLPMIKIEPLERRRHLDATISFAPHVDFTAGTKPVALATADFNADGNADLAVADFASDSINIFLGNGADAFTAGAVLQTGYSPVAVLTGDFNGDGSPDIAALCASTSANAPVTVAVFLSTGSDTFSAAEITTVAASAPANDPVAFTAADLNGDKKLDLAVTDYDNETVSILFGNNTGLFGTPVVYPGNSNPSAIVAGKFTGGSVPDLAITTVAPDPTTLVPAKSVSLLDNDGTGNFSLGQNIQLSTNSGDTSALFAADVTGVGAPDLVVGNTNSTASVLLNTGGQFELSSTPPLPAASTAVSAADFNLDGTIDLVSANGGTSAATSANSVSVISGNGDGTYVAALNFPTGTQPDDVVVADFNNDGKPDIATANAGGTVSILLNNTVTATIGTRTALTVSAASVPAGTSVDLTATVTPVATSKLPGETTPTGTVDYYDGSTFLGSAVITPGTSQAVFTENSLTVGSHRLTAVYQGDVGYSLSTSAAVTESITPTATQGPDLTAVFVSGSLPATVVPGETGTIKIRVTNSGNTLAAGVITNGLYLSLDTILDSSDLPVTLRGGLAKSSIHLKPGQSATLTGTYAIPAGIPLASYYPLVWVNQTGALAESKATNNVAIGPSAYSVLDAFGNVAGRPNIALQLTDADGTLATFRMTGPGDGTINVGDDGLDLSLDGTTTASSLTVTSRGGDSSFSISNLTADSVMGSIRAASVSITDSITLPDGASAITIGSIGREGTITLGAGPATALSLGTVTSTSLTAASGIRSIAVTSWSGTSVDTITAPWIGSIAAKTGFGPSLSLSGSGAPAGVALNSATINGPVGPAVWSIGGSVNRLKTGSIPIGWSGSVAGTVRSFTDTADFDGQFAATAFSSIAITGNLDNSDILAGANFGPDGRLNFSGSTFAAGTIGSIRIQGSVTDSVVAAGLNPDGSSLLGNTATLAPGSGIRTISITGAVDPTSRIVASTLPKTTRVGGAAVDPATDPRFGLNG